jgi:hypothetical protein
MADKEFWKKMMASQPPSLWQKAGENSDDSDYDSDFDPDGANVLDFNGVTNVDEMQDRVDAFRAEQQRREESVNNILGGGMDGRLGELLGAMMVRDYY